MDAETEKKRVAKGTRLPILWETINTISQIIVTLVGLTVAGLSYFHGSNIVMSAVRGGAAVLSIGLVLWLIYWNVARGSLDMMHTLIQERQIEVNQSANSSSKEYNG